MRWFWAIKISRNALASGFPALCFAYIEADYLKVVFAVDALPIPADRPNGPVAELCPVLA